MMPCVVAQVAALAHGAQVIVVGVLRHMIQMRDSQHDDRSCDRMRLAIDRSASTAVIVAALACAFAPIASALVPNAQRYRPPL